MNSTIPSRSRAQKSAKTRARKKNPLRAAKLVAKREVPAVKVFRSGREVCNLKTHAGKLEYLFRIAAMVHRQDGLCICGRDLISQFIPTFDHEDGRGMNASRRDDRIMKDGKPYNKALCIYCNSEKGSKRGYETTVRRTMRTTI